MPPFPASPQARPEGKPHPQDLGVTLPRARPTRLNVVAQLKTPVTATTALMNSRTTACKTGPLGRTARVDNLTIASPARGALFYDYVSAPALPSPGVFRQASNSRNVA